MLAPFSKGKENDFQGDFAETARVDRLPHLLCHSPDLHGVVRLSNHHLAYEVIVASVDLLVVSTCAIRAIIWSTSLLQFFDDGWDLIDISIVDAYNFRCAFCATNSTETAQHFRLRCQVPAFIAFDSWTAFRSIEGDRSNDTAVTLRLT